MIKNIVNEDALPIGTLADRSGLSIPTIRYYEEIGLIPSAKRRPNGHRYFDHDSEKLLTFIRNCRSFGFSIEQVRELIELTNSTERDCFDMREIAQTHLDAVRAKQTELRALEHSLSNLVKTCSDLCLGGPATQCSIVKDIGVATFATEAKPSCCS